tara:strand:+ start:1278 stop:3968 length:2691 start_codon:yes stop_codon:yes gene_type:complete
MAKFSIEDLGLDINNFANNVEYSLSDLGLPENQTNVIPRVQPLPGEIPEPYSNNFVPSGPRESSKGPMESVSGVLSPFTNPALDFMSGVNKIATGIVDFAITEPIEAVFRLSGSDIDIPQISDTLSNKTFSGGDAGKFYESGGEFAGIGVGINAAIAKQVQNVTKQAYKNFIGTDGILLGFGKEVAKTPLSKEALAGVGAATGGEIGKVAGPLGELAGNLLGGGLVFSGSKQTKDVSKIQRKAALVVKDFTEKGPNQALTNLEKRNNRIGLTSAQKTDDPLIMQLERDLAVLDNTLQGKIDTNFRLAQKSLQTEIQEILQPQKGDIPKNQDGSIDKGYLSRFYQGRKNDLMNQLDDRIRIAHENMVSQASIIKKDPILLSRASKNELNKMLDDVGGQERKLWSVIKDDAYVSKQPVVEAATNMIKNADKSSRLPVAELEFILGKKVTRGENGWKIGTKDLENGVFLKDFDRASEMMTLRSNLLADSRQQNLGTASTPVSVKYLSELQSATMKTLDNPLMADENVRGAYDTAREFSRRSHEIFDKGLIGKVLSTNRGGESVPAEGTLKTLLSSGEIAQAQATKELTELSLLYESIGGSSVRESKILKSATQFLANNFREKVTDVNSAQKWMVENRQALKSFPQLKNAVDEAFAGINKESSKIATAELRKELVGKTLISKLIGQSGKKAIKSVLNSIDPIATARELKRSLVKEPEAIAVFKSDIADYIIERILIASKSTGTDPAEQISKEKMIKVVNKELGPLIKQFYLKGDRNRLNKILSDVASITISNSRKPKSLPPQRNGLIDIVGRLTAVTTVSKAARSVGGGGSIVLQSRAAELGRSITDDLTDTQVRKILVKAMTNDDVMKVLLKTNINTTDKATLSRYFPFYVATLNEKSK